MPEGNSFPEINADSFKVLVAERRINDLIDTSHGQVHEDPEKLGELDRKMADYYEGLGETDMTVSEQRSLESRQREFLGKMGTLASLTDPKNEYKPGLSRPEREQRVRSLAADYEDVWDRKVGKGAEAPTFFEVLGDYVKVGKQFPGNLSEARDPKFRKLEIREHPGEDLGAFLGEYAAWRRDDGKTGSPNFAEARKFDNQREGGRRQKGVAARLAEKFSRN